MSRYDVDYSMLPEHMREVAEDYIERGLEPGGFLYAVLTNNLVGAVAKADMANRFLLPVWAGWLFNEAPSQSWGSPEKVTAWMDSHA